MYNLYEGEMEMCFLHIPTTPESGVVAKDKPLLMGILEQLGLSALLKGRSTKFPHCQLIDLN
jgi:hypothetical protein